MAVGRSRLARVIGPILIFLGALLITAAIAGPVYVADKLKTVPLDLDITSVAKSTKPTDSNADAEFPARSLDLCSFNQPKAVVNNTQVTTQTRTLVTSPSDKSTMTVQSGMSMVNSAIKTNGDPKRPELSNANLGERPCGDGLVQAWIDRVSLDRESAEPTGETSETVFSPGERAPAVKVADRTGQQYRFPAGTTQDGQYQYYDLVTRGAAPLTFVEEQEVSGAKTLHFRGVRDWVDLSTVRDTKAPTLGTVLTKTAGWWGIGGGVDPKDDITLNRWAKTDVDLWVNPDTGVIVDQSLRYTQQFRLPAQVAPNTPRAVRDYKLDVFDAQQRWVEDTVRSQADAAKSQETKLTLANRVVPIVGGILGAIALLLGLAALFLSRGPRTPVRVGDDGPRTERVSGAPTARLDDDAQTSRVGDTPTTTTATTSDDEPVTEAFNAQPRPDESTTEALDLRKRDDRR